MKLFIVGPVQMYNNVLKIREKDFPYFRTEHFSNIMLNNAKRLSLLLGCKSIQNLLFFTMSGTGAMEAAVQNCIFDTDKCIVINGGTFGQRFCDLLDWHNKKYTSINLNWNEKLTEEHLKKLEGKNYTTLLVNLHETSTGQLYDINLLSNFCKKNNLKLIVDAISTSLADDFNMDKYNIDAAIISSQKGLCCSAGMSIIAVSDKLKTEILNHRSQTLYFNFGDYFKNMKRGQTPYTPAVGIAYELNEMLNLIDKTTEEVWLKNIKNKALYFRTQANKLGFKIPNSYNLSNMLTPLYFEDEIASDVVRILRDDFDIYINPCGGELANKLVRISHIGNTNIKDIDELLEKLVIVTKKIKEEAV